MHVTLIWRAQKRGRQNLSTKRDKRKLWGQALCCEDLVSRIRNSLMLWQPCAARIKDLMSYVAALCCKNQRPYVFLLRTNLHGPSKAQNSECFRLLHYWRTTTRSPRYAEREKRTLRINEQTLRINLLAQIKKLFESYHLVAVTLIYLSKLIS